MGPFELADYVGLDTNKFIMDGWSSRFPSEPLFRWWIIIFLFITYLTNHKQSQYLIIRWSTICFQRKPNAQQISCWWKTWKKIRRRILQILINYLINETSNANLCIFIIKYHIILFVINLKFKMFKCKECWEMSDLRIECYDDKWHWFKA